MRGLDHQMFFGLSCGVLLMRRGNFPPSCAKNITIDGVHPVFGLNGRIWAWMSWLLRLRVALEEFRFGRVCVGRFSVLWSFFVECPRFVSCLVFLQFCPISADVQLKRHAVVEIDILLVNA